MADFEEHTENTVGRLGHWRVAMEYDKGVSGDTLEVYAADEETAGTVALAQNDHDGEERVVGRLYLGLAPADAVEGIAAGQPGSEV